jgi:hypothetical protein
VAVTGLTRNQLRALLLSVGSNPTLSARKIKFTINKSNNRLLSKPPDFVLEQGAQVRAAQYAVQRSSKTKSGGFERSLINTRAQLCAQNTKTGIIHNILLCKTVAT